MADPIKLIQRLFPTLADFKAVLDAAHLSGYDEISETDDYGMPTEAARQAMEDAAELLGDDIVSYYEKLKPKFVNPETGKIPKSGIKALSNAVTKEINKATTASARAKKETEERKKSEEASKKVDKPSVAPAAWMPKQEQTFERGDPEQLRAEMAPLFREVMQKSGYSLRGLADSSEALATFKKLLDRYSLAKQLEKGPNAASTPDTDINDLLSLFPSGGASQSTVNSLKRKMGLIVKQEPGQASSKYIKSDEQKAQDRATVEDAIGKFLEIENEKDPSKPWRAFWKRTGYKPGMFIVKQGTSSGQPALMVYDTENKYAQTDDWKKMKAADRDFELAHHPSKYITEKGTQPLMIFEGLDPRKQESLEELKDDELSEEDLDAIDFMNAHPDKLFDGYIDQKTGNYKLSSGDYDKNMTPVHFSDPARQAILDFMGKHPGWGIKENGDLVDPEGNTFYTKNILNGDFSQVDKLGKDRALMDELYDMAQYVKGNPGVSFDSDAKKLLSDEEQAGVADQFKYLNDYNGWGKDKDGSFISPKGLRLNKDLKKIVPGFNKDWLSDSMRTTDFSTLRNRRNPLVESVRTMGLSQADKEEYGYLKKKFTPYLGKNFDVVVAKNKLSPVGLKQQLHKAGFVIGPDGTIRANLTKLAQMAPRGVEDPYEWAKANDQAASITSEEYADRENSISNMLMNSFNSDVRQRKQIEKILTAMGKPMDKNANYAIVTKTVSGSKGKGAGGNTTYNSIARVDDSGNILELIGDTKVNGSYTPEVRKMLDDLSAEMKEARYADMSPSRAAKARIRDEWNEQIKSGTWNRSEAESSIDTLMDELGVDDPDFKHSLMRTINKNDERWKKKAEKKAEREAKSSYKGDDGYDLSKQAKQDADYNKKQNAKLVQKFGITPNDNMSPEAREQVKQINEETKVENAKAIQEAKKQKSKNKKSSEQLDVIKRVVNDDNFFNFF